jgi:hypothetical protein
MNLAEALGDRIGPFPAWLWALGLGGGLYLFAHYKSTGSLPSFPISNTMTPLDSGGGGQIFGSPAALAGPVLELNPMASNGIGSQPAAGLVPAGQNVPTAVPAVSGGDNPFTSGYVGLQVATPYDYARGGPS